MSRVKPVEVRRVQFNCLISPATFNAIIETAKLERISQGVVIDRAVALLAFGEEIECHALADRASRIMAKELTGTPAVVFSRPFKAPIPKPKERK